MKNDEALIQVQIVKELQSRGIWVHSVPNEAAGGNKIRAMQMISMGLRSGVADLEVWKGDKTLYLEIKTPQGKQSETQKRFQQRCEEMGRIYRIARSVQEAIDIVENL